MNPDLLLSLSSEKKTEIAVNYHRSGQLDKAESVYRIILKADPSHPDANHNLGVLLLSIGDGNKALPYLKRALESNPAIPQFWLSYINALIGTHEIQLARKVLIEGQQHGLAGSAVDALVERLAIPRNEANGIDVTHDASLKLDVFAPAVELREAGHYNHAEKWLQDWLLTSAANHQSAELISTAYAHLAHIQLLDKNDAAASQSIARAISMAPQLPIVLRNQARILLKAQRPDEALFLAQEATRKDPTDIENLLLLAVSLAAKDDKEQAMLLINDVINRSPEYAEALAHRALLKLKLNNKAGAHADLEAALILKPHLTQLWLMLANIRHELNDLSGAMSVLEKALLLDPKNVGWLVNLGEFKRQAYQTNEAIILLKKAVEISPDNVSAWTNLGAVFQSAGEIEQAREAYGKALLIDPTQAEVANNLGILAQNINAFEDALLYFEHAIHCQPSNPQFLANRGAALLELRRPPQVIEAVAREIIQIAPQNAAGYRLLGGLNFAQGNLESARDQFRLALEKEPCSAEIHLALGSINNSLIDLHAADIHLRQALILNPMEDKAYSGLLFLKNYLTTDSKFILRDEATVYGEMIRRKVKKRYTDWQCKFPYQRLRIGFVSGDLRMHPVAYFLENILNEIDTSRIDLFAYPTFNLSDEVTARFRRFFQGWTPLFGLSDQAAAERIRADGIHVLIDLSGHTAHNRLPVFSYKPSPVQVSWLGYFATTGVAEIDYIIADPTVCPESESTYFTEKIWRLPDSYLCFTPPIESPGVSALPAIKNGFTTFGCFNNLTKMNDDVVTVWANVLNSIPESRLFLKTKQLVDTGVIKSIQDRFMVHGIKASRLILEGPSPRIELLAAYHRVDIALDPFPYPGGTTSVEALWMGVPVITRKGDRFLSRVGETIANNAGLPAWVAADADDYVAKTVAFSRDLTALASLRASLRDKLLASPLLDAPRFAKNFEQAVWGMWHQWNEASKAS